MALDNQPITAVAPQDLDDASFNNNHNANHEPIPPNTQNPRT